ncbi:MAG: DUF2238 domain-containing protein [Nanoarchaeota archaeon]
MAKRVKNFIFKEKTNPLLLFFILMFILLLYFFLGQRFDSLGFFSKLIMCILTLGTITYSYHKKGLANLFLVINAGFWTFISLTVSFGSTYAWNSPIVINLVIGPWMIFIISYLVSILFGYAFIKMKNKDGYHLLLFILFLWIWLILAFNVKYFNDWILENIINLTFLIILYLTHRWFKYSRLSYGLMFVFMVLNIIGSHYTYAEVPFGYWLKDFLALGRNHYDRVVHFCFGFLMVYAIRETFIRISRVKGFWSLYLPIEFVLALSAIYEIIEWLTAVIFGGDLGIAYLGTQGDEFDAVKDMALAGLGALITMTITFIALMHYDRERYWKEFKDSFYLKKERLGEEAIKRLQGKR